MKLLDIENTIKNQLANIVKMLYSENIDIELVTNFDNDNFGDYSTNLAFKLANILKQDKNDIAQNIVSHISNIPFIKNIEVTNGYINFYFDTTFFYLLFADNYSNNYIYENNNESILL